MRERVCKNCGGRTYKVVGQNMVKCMFCGTLYVDEQASKEEAVLIVKANELLRQFKFEEAVAEFDKILALYPMSYESFFGKALAKNKIVLYTNKRGLKQFPKFFGEIVSIKDDENFVKAVELAPQEVEKKYKEISRRIDKILNASQSVTEETDVFVLPAKADEQNEKLIQMLEALQKQKNRVFLFSSQKEEFVFNALKTSKVFLFIVNTDKNFINGDLKNVYDRYLYFISEKQKAKSSFVVVLDGVEDSKCPAEVRLNKNFFDMQSISFLEDILHKVEKEKKTTLHESAKIEKVEVELVEPEHIDYVDIETIEPTELGTYDVKNIELSDANKVKWIFLSLKHGDFAAAQDFVSQEIEKDPNNSQILFAQLLIDRRIKTKEEFFENISNFNDKEMIDKILKYASKDFAEEFVNKWEELLINLDSVDYYQTYLLYLAKYNTERREKFISAAEAKALETLDEELIEKVVKCFDKNDVKRYVEFYFDLAQKSDNQDFYDKVLTLDEGHEQSNLMKLLQRFKTTENKLNYQNKEEVENVLKFLNEEARSHFVSSIVEMILPIAFLDIEKACAQLDFYLPYISNEEILVAQLKKIGSEFLTMEFFKPAEKYFSIALSKASEAELYWELIKAKAHCKTEQDLILTNVKVTKFPEWETLLSVSNEKQTEYYAEIISKINLYKGERQSFKADLLDKVNLSIKLEEFVNRNYKILLEFEKQQQTSGVNYFKVQLVPFEKYLKKIDDIKTFEAYLDFVKRIKSRLSALELSLDSSINVTHLEKHKEANTLLEEEIKQKNKTKKTIKDLKRDAVLKRFCFIFIELCPLLFIAGLLVFLIASPKETYLNFSQIFFSVCLIISVFLAIVNLILFTYKKNKVDKRQKLGYITIIVLGILNLILFCLGLFMPCVIEIANASEMKRLLANAPHANYVLVADVDFSEKEWKSLNFSGSIDGKNYALKNVAFEDGCLFSVNDGEIANLKIYLAEKDYKEETFAAIAKRNSGEIQNCQVYGSISLKSDSNMLVGGVVAKNDGGIIENCLTEISVVAEATGGEIVFGGIAGQSTGGGIKHNISSTNLRLASNAGSLKAGGLIGNLHESIVNQNETIVDFLITGNVENALVGGLVGLGRQESENNLTSGKITSTATGLGYVGGLYGQYENTHLSEKIQHSYSTIEFQTDFSNGSLIGNLGGTIDSCFATANVEFVGNKMFNQAKVSNCEKEYKLTLQFDEDIWDVSQIYPTLK